MERFRGVYILNNNHTIENNIKNLFKNNIGYDFTIYELSEALEIQSPSVKAGINRLVKKGKVLKTSELRFREGSNRGSNVYKLSSFSKETYRRSLETLYNFMNSKMEFGDNISNDDINLIKKVEMILGGSETE